MADHCCCLPACADAPGCGPDDVTVEVHEGVLHLGLERKVEREDKDKEGRVWCHERGYQHLSRSFTLPDGALPDGIQASMDKGVLTITVPKAPPTEPKRITVQVAQALPAAPAHA